MKPYQNPYMIYAVMAVCYSAVVIPTWGPTYWDFGDGNYMYIARRVREGLTLYKDILAPQPPLHTYAGVVAQSLGEWLFNSALIGTRIYCLFLRLLAGFLVMAIALEFFRCRSRALLAAAIYLSLPLGFWWSKGYQSENLQIPFLLIAILSVLKRDPRWLLGGGIASAIAALSDMTAMPYFFVNCLFLLCRAPKLLAYFAAPAVMVYAIIGGFFQWLTAGYFFTNVVVNQAGTFPRTEILRLSDPTDHFFWYAYRKVTEQSLETLLIQGGFIMAAFAGLGATVAGFVKKKGEGEDRWQTEYLCWMAIGLMLSIGYVIKGGTVNYKFTIGEPAVALFSAHAIALLFAATWPDRAALRELGFHNTIPFLRTLFPVLTVFFIASLGIRNIYWTMTEVQVELPAREVRILENFIRTYTQPGERILAPPFYAWQSDTVVAAELAENYIWQIKHMNESFDGIEGPAHAKFRELADQLSDGSVKVVLLDMTLTGRIPVVAQAIAEHYQPAEPQPIRTRNTQLMLYIRNEDTLRHFPIFPRQ